MHSGSGVVVFNFVIPKRYGSLDFVQLITVPIPDIGVVATNWQISYNPTVLWGFFDFFP